jgi:hypothetical protein
MDDTREGVRPPGRRVAAALLLGSLGMSLGVASFAVDWAWPADHPITDPSWVYSALFWVGLALVAGAGVALDSRPDAPAPDPSDWRRPALSSIGPRMLLAAAEALHLPPRLTLAVLLAPAVLALLSEPLGLAYRFLS